MARKKKVKPPPDLGPVDDVGTPGGGSGGLNAEAKQPAKNPHAQSLGRLGGLKGGAARAKSLTPEQRSEIARKAVTARWAKKKSK